MPGFVIAIHYSDEIIVTRDGDTNDIKTYVNGELIQFEAYEGTATNDSTNVFTFSAAETTFDLFKDNDVGDYTEDQEADGRVEYAEVWNEMKDVSSLERPACLSPILPGVIGTDGNF